MNGDSLIRKISEAKSNDNDLVYDLLQLFYQEFPIEKLNQMLSSDNENLLEAGVYIASELPYDSVIAVVDNIIPLLKHKNEYIRHLSVSCILECAKSLPTESLIFVLDLLADDSPLVRWNVMNYLYYLSDSERDNIYSYLVTHIPDSPHLDGLEKLTNINQDTVSDNTVSLLKSKNIYDNVYGAVLSLIIFRFDSAPLSYAEQLDNKEIATFVAEIKEDLQEDEMDNEASHLSDRNKIH